MIYIDRNLKMPLHEQVYIRVKDAILQGSFAAGTRLPATRTLAAELGVGRNTVITAYKNLADEGYVRSIGGSGFIVQNVRTDLHQTAWTPEKPEEISETPEIRYDFWSPLTRECWFPKNAWSRALSDALEEIERRRFISYPERKGSEKLRNELAQHLYLSRGVVCSPEQIVISCGMQFNLEMLLKLFDPAKDTVGMEDPGYYGVWNVFRSSGFSLHPIPVKSDGLDTASLRRHKLKLLYITPSHQFPTGAVLPIDKRMDILDWAGANKAFIIEDDYDSELQYNGSPIPSLQALDHFDRVIYTGTFSKSLSSSIRASYMVLPKQLIEPYQKRCGDYLAMVSILIQTALADLIADGSYKRHLDRLRIAFSTKHEAFVKSLDQVFGDRIDIIDRQAGSHLLISVRNDMSAQELTEAALEMGIKVYPVSEYYLNRKHKADSRLILGFGGVRNDEYIDALTKLRDAWFGQNESRGADTADSDE